MNVGVVVDNDFHHDVRVKREVRMLSKLGYSVHVLCFSFSGDKKVSTAEEVTIDSIRIARKTKDLLYFFMNIFPLYEWLWKRWVSAFCRKYDIDIIHTHDLYMSKAVRKGSVREGRRIPLILDLHENYPYAIQSYKWSQGWLRSILVRPNAWIRKEREYLKLADRYILLSEGFKESLLAKYDFLDSKDILVFPNVVDTEDFDKYPLELKSEVSLPPKPRLLYFGMVASRRGIFKTLDVCEKLVKRGIEFTLLIIGPVDSADKQLFFERIKYKDFDGVIKYIPWIELKELPSYLNACDIALAPFDKNPQHESGIANKIFQYMYGKLPIVASNCKPQQELIEKYDIGEVFSSQKEFEEKLHLLIQNESLRKEKGNSAFDVLMEHFHQDSLVPKLERFYREIII